MWTFPFKDHNNCACTKDIDELVDHCRALVLSDKVKLKKLYIKYFHNHGFAKMSELKPLESKKEDIKGQYENKFKPGENLRYIRDELFSKIEKCPFCGMTDIETLDHYMDKSDYGQLACCRYNLVPSCWKCNWIKHQQPYGYFVHAYFAQYPDKYFLITDITVVNKHVGFRMRIDKNAINDPVLACQTESQFVKLDLYNRYRKEGLMYIVDTLSSLKCDNDHDIKLALIDEANKWESIYGKHHWKTSIARGLMNCCLINIDVINHYKQYRIDYTMRGI